MGIGPANLGLYHHLARDGLFHSGQSVMELGSEDVTAEGYEDLIGELFEVLGKPKPATAELRRLTTASGRDLYAALGFSYSCIDADGRNNALTMDLNFEDTPSEELGRYDLVTNLGTAEHVCQDSRAFRVAHELAKPGGLILHIAPFIGYLNHGFRNYQPEFFRSLARTNGYDFLGFWINLDGWLPSYIPWDETLLKFIDLKPGTNAALVALFRKPHAHPYSVPFQRDYEPTMSDKIAMRYTYVVDGDRLDGRLVKDIAVRSRSSLYLPERLPLTKIARILVEQFVRRVRRRLRR